MAESKEEYLRLVLLDKDGGCCGSCLKIDIAPSDLYFCHTYRKSGKRREFCVSQIVRRPVGGANPAGVENRDFFRDY